MVGTGGDHILSHVAGDIQHIGLFHAARNGHGAVIDLLAVGGQRLRLILHIQQVAQHTVGIAGGFRGSGDVNKGDAGLLLQSVQVLGNAALGLTHINDDLCAALEQRFRIQLSLAAVKLTDFGHSKVFLVQILLGFGAPCVGHAYQLIGAERKQHDLGHGAAERHLVDLCRHLYLAAHRVGEHAGRVICLRATLCAAGRQTQHHDDGQQHRKPFFYFHLSSSLFYVFGKSSTENFRQPTGR